MPIPERKKRGPFGLKSRKHQLQERLAQIPGKPTAGMRTNYTCNGKKVIFLHNPKTGGSSLGKMLGVKRISHSFASVRLSKRHWLKNYSVVAVREPFERFLSGYYSHILRPDKNGLTKEYGMEIKNISPFDYIELLAENPRYGSLQSYWVNYPSSSKPTANLILKFENISQWTDQLESRGINLEGKTLAHENPSANRNANHLDRLKLTKVKFQCLKDATQQFFASDYKQFEY
ncbi:sulfotransferase family 2 domain-containing protein [Profundibacter sp.]